MARREPLYDRYPDYRVDLEPNPTRVTVRVGGQTIADSTRTLRVRETNHAPVLYFPREDVRMDLLEPTSHESFCPFKGEASYWSLRRGDRVEENLVWSYPEPFEQVAGLKGYVSFYPDRVELEEAG
jgi:uncharacterized protein (DUF427 family)